MTVDVRSSGIDPRVWAVVVNWNRWQDTAECVDSLRLVDYTALETVVVDNGSSDDSVVHLRRAFPLRTLIASRENLGFAGGCNLGLRHAIANNATYFWLVNNDAVVAPDRLRRLIAVAETHLSERFFGSWITYYDDPERL